LLAATAEQPECSAPEASNLGRMLMGYFRRGDFNDPEMFALGLAATFAEFPLTIGKQVVDPIKGLPSRLKFPPTIAEVREALDVALAKRRAIAYRAQWMLDERQRREDEERNRAELSPERRAEIVARLAEMTKPKTAEAAE
jgi:hypothetical protein